MARGIIFGSLWKNSAIARLQTRTPSCHSLFWHCALLLFLYFSNFFHLFEHCSPVTLTDELALNNSATLSYATFLRTLPLSKRSVFSRRSEINNLVLFDDRVTSFSSFSSPVMR